MSHGFSKGKVVAAFCGAGAAFYLGNRVTSFAMGFHRDLKLSFTPVWQEIFDVPKVLHTSSGISAGVDAYSNNRADLVGRTGQTPWQRFRYAVNIDYRATWDQNQKSEDFVYVGKAVWHVTISMLRLRFSEVGGGRS